MRRYLACSRSLILAFLLMRAPVSAAEVASFHVLGFSPDGRHFAFMEHGVQDGSGFPFVSIYVIDLQRDSWVPGTPVRVLVQHESADSRPAMRRALRQARQALRQVGIDLLLRGRTLFHAPAWEGAGPATRATFVLHAARQGQAEDTYVLDLATHYLPRQRSACRPDEVMRARGFSLTLKAGASEPKRVHVDDSVPASRGCPISYAIDSVITLRPRWRQPTRAVVIVRYGYQAFEGMDERYLAVPVMLPPLP